MNINVLVSSETITNVKVLLNSSDLKSLNVKLGNFIELSSPLTNQRLLLKVWLSKKALKGKCGISAMWKPFIDSLDSNKTAIITKDLPE